MRALLLALALLAPLPALAHPGDGHVHGLAAGLLHPLGGLDHLMAMVAVGAWAGILGGAARLALPAGFLAAMALGGVLGMAGIALPMVEAGILASVIVLGALIASAARLPTALAVAMVAVAGLLHGHAHGAELSGGVLGYAAGFLVATAALHAAGLLLTARSATPRIAVRLAGATCAVVACAMLVLPAA
jgi:urease accessory protein